MAWYLNPSGYSVWLNRDDIARITKRGDLHRFSPRLFRHEGDGPKKKIAIIFASYNGSNGIGDYVHGMPALTEKVKAGFECHVFTTEFFRPFVEWCGAIFEDGSSLGVGSLAQFQKEYGEVYSLLHWCINHDEESFGDVWKTRFDQIAEFLGVTLPESYSWKDVFELPSVSNIPTGEPPVVIAVQSTSRERSYTKVAELAESLKQEGLEVVILGGGNAHKESFHKTTKTAQELIEIVSQSSVVIACDNGILALALALEIPTIGLFGPTDEKTIALQFSRYVNTENVRIVRSQKEDSCSRPCSLQGERGFHQNEKCRNGIMSDCMAEIEPRVVIGELTKLLAHVSL